MHEKLSHTLQKRTSQLETKIKALEEFKMDKLSEEKKLKTKMKKVNKKLKDVQEKESKLKLGRFTTQKLDQTINEVENNDFPLHEPPLANSEEFNPICLIKSLEFEEPTIVTPQAASSLALDSTFQNAIANACWKLNNLRKSW